MSKIAIDARELRTSTGRYIERLIHYLQIVDKKNDYVIILKPEDVDSWRPTNANFSKIACTASEFTFAEQVAFKKQLEHLKPDLVHFGMVQQPVWYKGKVVTTIHDLTTLRFVNPAKNPVVFKIKQRIYSYVIKKAARKSAYIITPTLYVKNDLINYTGISSMKIIVTHESADPITDAPEPVLELEGKRFLMYVGRPTPHKNLERLIEAFVELQKDRPDLVLALAGKKDLNYLRIENKVKAKNINNVIFTDFISEGQLRWMYEHCATYVFPSLSEGFGLPGLEAMVHGAPVVSSNATCLPEVYREAAEYFDPLDTKAIVRAIDRVLTDTTLRKELISAGKRRVKDFSWERMAEQTLKVYEDALG